VKNKFNLNVQVLHTDGERSISKATKHAIRSLGITLEQTAPYNPDQNSKAEGAWGLLSTKSRYVHVASGLPWWLWPEFYTCSGELLNLTPFEVLEWKTPMEVLQLYLNGLSEHTPSPPKVSKD